MNNIQIPMQLIQTIKSGGNPQSILMNMINNNSNPMTKNLMSMMNNNDYKGIEQFARNLCQSRGIDADAMYNQIQQNFRYLT